MKRKILHNSKNTFTGYSKGKIGTPLPIVDKEGNQIVGEMENMVWRFLIVCGTEIIHMILRLTVSSLKSQWIMEIKFI